MLATTHTMFENEKIIRIYSFCPFSSWNTRQMQFKRSIVTKPSYPSPLFDIPCGGHILSSAEGSSICSQSAHIGYRDHSSKVNDTTRYRSFDLGSFCTQLYTVKLANLTVYISNFSFTTKFSSWKFISNNKSFNNGFILHEWYIYWN